MTDPRSTIVRERRDRVLWSDSMMLIGATLSVEPAAGRGTEVMPRLAEED